MIGSNLKCFYVMAGWLLTKCLCFFVCMTYPVVLMGFWVWLQLNTEVFNHVTSCMYFPGSGAVCINIKAELVRAVIVLTQHAVKEAICTLAGVFCNPRRRHSPFGNTAVITPGSAAM